MNDIQKLTAHIDALISAKPQLVAYFTDNWLFMGLPDTFPCIYIDGISCLDDKQDSWNMNINFVTEDMSLEAFGVARDVLNTLQRGSAILTRGLYPRPEPDTNRNRFQIPATVYMRSL